MKVDILLGLQWGDEGKGKVVDVLTPKYDVVARFQGGPNAGHTLEFQNKKYVLRSIPSGIFQGNKVNIIGNGVVLDPALFKAEAAALEESGHSLKNRLHISKKAHLIMPTHRVADSLILGENGELTCRMGDTEGDFDLVPILNAFLAEHPDFSYEGARATIALCGYEGLFGMELDRADEIWAVADKLRQQGYDIACYTYDDMEYADFGVAGLKEDLDKWFSEITPVLGETDILVYPTGGDIMGKEAYSGSKYEALRGYGFRYYVGTGSGENWGMTTGSYARQIRTIVTGANLAENPEWYTGLFDASAVLSADR